MHTPRERKVTNKKFSDPEWYVSLTVDLLDFKFATLAKNLGKALKPEVSDTKKELLKMFEVSFNRVLKDVGVDQEVVTNTDQEDLFSESILDPRFPSFHPLFNLLLEGLAIESSNDYSSNQQGSWKASRRNLRAKFATAFNILAQEKNSDFKNATKYIDYLKEYSEPLESQVTRHMNSIIEEVEYESLAIDKCLTLRKSYITPSCTFKKITPRDEFDADLKQEKSLLKSITNNIKSSSLPMVIHGQPGHGKTSSVKILAAVLPQIYKKEEKPIVVLFYELKNLRSLNDSVVRVLNSETKFLESEEFFFDKDVVLILDGLDERQITDGSDEALKGFIASLFYLSRKINEQPNSKLNLILTGRTQFVGQIKSSFNSDYLSYEIKDFSKGQIELWLKRFNKQRDGGRILSIDRLEKYHLQELITQPILLAISSIMLVDDDGERLLKKLGGNVINRSQIYKVIVEWSYHKKWQKIPSSSSLKDTLNFDEYFVLLQAISFEMFLSGKESIKLSKLSSDLKESIFDMDFIKNKSIENIEKICSQLRISFFFKGVEEKAFSFIHKSIKDFLVVSGVIDALLIVLDDCNPKKIERESSELYKILSGNELSVGDHIPMLREWVDHKSSEFKPHASKMVAIWERVGQRDLPHSFSAPNLAVIAQRNIYLNYYQIVSRYFSKTTAEENKSIFNSEKAVLFNCNEPDSKLPTILSFLNYENIVSTDGLCFSNQLLINKKFNDNDDVREMNVHGFDFSNSEIYQYSFSDVKFSNCNFENCNFHENWLTDTEFHECNFKNAIVELDFNTDSGISYFEGYMVSFHTSDFSNSKLSISLSASLKGDATTDMSSYGLKHYSFLNCFFDLSDFTNNSFCTILYDESFQGKRFFV